MRDRLQRLALNLLAVVVAAIFAGAVTSLILAIRGDSPTDVINQMWDYGTQPNTEVSILDSAAVYYLSAVAVAIGFRMNLFNIGVDGQYRLAACVAGAFAGSVALPTGLRQAATILV
ncbi:MAG: ral nucleoside transport system permease protein, partial [Pseudonocardiales bacterium]|nr:ral nucleoside transport system permease protein [Pseudonocardiales bacterium]